MEFQPWSIAEKLLLAAMGTGVIGLVVVGVAVVKLAVKGPAARRVIVEVHDAHRSDPR